MIDKIKQYFWMAAAILSFGLLCWQTVQLQAKELELADAAVAIATERREASDKLREETDRNRKTEQGLADSAATVRKEANEKVDAATARADGLLQRVRLAEARAKSLAQVPSTSATASDGQAASGDDEPELLGTFGEEDVLEARRAETIRLQLVACYRQYDQARDALKGE